MIIIETSVGDALDKLSILDIKREKIFDKNALINVQREYEIIHTAVNNFLSNSGHPCLADNSPNFYYNLRNINLTLWEVEDEIRELESRKKFDESFVELARAVYLNNDERASIKRAANLFYGSKLIEEKSYKRY